MTRKKIKLKVNEFQAEQYDGTQAEYIIDIDGFKHVVVSRDTMCPVDVGDWIIFMDGEPQGIITDDALKEHYDVLEEELEDPKGS